MAYRKSGSFKPRTTASISPVSGSVKNSGRDYLSEQSGSRRHSLSTSTSDVGTGALLTGEYFGFTLCRFKRTFAPGVTDDVEPTPTTSNNYQSKDVMNGSRISQLSAKFRIVNTGTSTPANLDVYMVAVSFYDVLVWNTVFSALCPFTFNTTGGVGDNRGFIDYKAMTATLVTDNEWKNYKFIQHYLKKLGTLSIGNADSGKNEVEMTINQIPPQCRRSQTGMFYGILFHNEASKNASATVNVNPFLDLKFLETPTTNRLPYIT